MARQKYPIRKLQRKLNQVTFLVVLALGALAMLTITAQPERYSKTEPVAVRELASVDQDRDYTTDFIQLSEGENQLSVKHILSDGKVEERKFVVRRQ